MYVLILIAYFTGKSSSITTQEFSSQQTCLKALQAAVDTETLLLSPEIKGRCVLK